MLIAESLKPLRESDVLSRVERTLELMERWGYAPQLECLAEQLLGGRVSVENLRASIHSSPRIGTDRTFVYHRGREDLVRKSMERAASDQILNGKIRTIAKEFAKDLSRHCPFVECVALSGSAASGGFGPGDDIDFDLFVLPGTKYASYLLAILVGLKYSWRERRRELDEFYRTPLLPKVICINVVWPRDETQPFVRQDEGLAFELLRCVPLVGTGRYRDVLYDNPWLVGYLPQLFERDWSESFETPLSPIGRFLCSVGRRPRALRWFERLSRRIDWVLYHLVQASRAKNPAARERMDFLRRVKYPYEIFQDHAS